MTPPRARFGGIDIVPQDMAKSVEFYRELGLDIPDSEIWIQDGVMHHTDLHFEGEFGLDIDSEKMTMAYAPAWEPGSGVVFMFRTDTREDVDSLHDHMVSLGHKSHTAPFDAFWGARYAILVDPGGNLVSLMSPMDKDMGGPPPEV
jgi:uncharacterized glyoxalase superfamily protein PhnB